MALHVPLFLEMLSQWATVAEKHSMKGWRGFFKEASLFSPSQAVPVLVLRLRHIFWISMQQLSDLILESDRSSILL